MERSEPENFAQEAWSCQNLVGVQISGMALPRKGTMRRGPGRDLFFLRYVICSKRVRKARRDRRKGAADANMLSIVASMAFETGRDWKVLF